MINSFILVTLLWNQGTMKINLADIQNIAALPTSVPGCAVLVDWIENDVQVAGSCNELRAKIKATTQK